MNDVERRLKQLGEHADRELPAEMRPRGAALRRIRMRRRLLGGSVALCVALLVAGGAVVVADPAPDRPDLPPAEDRTEEPPGPPERAERCGVPFEPTYLPPGFSAKAREGSGGGAPAQPAAPVAAHFRGPNGRFVDVVASSRGSFAQTDTARVTVLGRHGVLGAIHEGFSVEFRVGRCRYELLGYGVTRRELRDFATGLVGTEEGTGPYFGAVWPEDTLAEARRGCAGRGRTRATAVARRFAEEVLLWLEPDVVVEGRGNEWTLEVTPAHADAPEPGVDAGVRVRTREVLRGCWSVVAVSPLAERRLDALGVSVIGNTAEIVFERYGATSATVEFGYGTHTTLEHWQRGEDATTLPVNGRGSSTGHFLVVLLDSAGDAFAAIGRPLPPGNFAAG